MDLAVDVRQLVHFIQQLGVESLQDAPLGVVRRRQRFQLAPRRLAARLQSRVLLFKDLPKTRNKPNQSRRLVHSLNVNRINGSTLCVCVFVCLPDSLFSSFSTWRRWLSERAAGVMTDQLRFFWPQNKKKTLLLWLGSITGARSN